MNRVFLKGNVGQEPKITKFEDGMIAQFTLATTERGYTTRSGKEVKEKTWWHNIVIRKAGLAGVVEKYVQKGTPVLVSGTYGYRDYERNGEQKRIYEVYADELELCGGQKKEESYDDLPPDFAL